MMKDFGGPDICGIGFAMGMERVLSVPDDRPGAEEPLYLAYLGDEARDQAWSWPASSAGAASSAWSNTRTGA